MGKNKMVLDELFSTVLGGILVVIGNYLIEHFRYKIELKKLKMAKMEELFSLLLDLAKDIKKNEVGMIYRLENDYKEISLIIRLYFPHLKSDWQGVVREFSNKNYNKSLELIQKLIAKIEEMEY